MNERQVKNLKNKKARQENSSEKGSKKINVISMVKDPTFGWAEGNQIHILEHASQRNRHPPHQCPQKQIVLLSYMEKTLTSLHCLQICREISKITETDNTLITLANYKRNSFASKNM